MTLLLWLQEKLLLLEQLLRGGGVTGVHGGHCGRWCEVLKRRLRVLQWRRYLRGQSCCLSRHLLLGSEVFELRAPPFGRARTVSARWDH